MEVSNFDSFVHVRSFTVYYIQV